MIRHIMFIVSRSLHPREMKTEKGSVEMTLCHTDLLDWHQSYLHIHYMGYHSTSMCMRLPVAFNYPSWISISGCWLLCRWRLNGISKMRRVIHAGANIRIFCSHHIRRKYNEMIGCMASQVNNRINSHISVTPKSDRHASRWHCLLYVKCLQWRHASIYDLFCRPHRRHSDGPTTRSFSPFSTVNTQKTSWSLDSILVVNSGGTQLN